MFVEIKKEDAIAIQMLIREQLRDKTELLDGLGNKQYAKQITREIGKLEGMAQTFDNAVAHAVEHPELAIQVHCGMVRNVYSNVSVSVEVYDLDNEDVDENGVCEADKTKAELDEFIAKDEVAEIW